MRLDAEVVLDGEVVAFDDDGTPSFFLLGQRPANFIVFDLLFQGGDCCGLPYEARRDLLEQLTSPQAGGPQPAGCWVKERHCSMLSGSGAWKGSSPRRRGRSTTRAGGRPIGARSPTSIGAGPWSVDSWQGRGLAPRRLDPCCSGCGPPMA